MTLRLSRAIWDVGVFGVVPAQFDTRVKLCFARGHFGRHAVEAEHPNAAESAVFLHSARIACCAFAPQSVAYAHIGYRHPAQRRRTRSRHQARQKYATAQVHILEWRVVARHNARTIAVSYPYGVIHDRDCSYVMLLFALPIDRT